MNNLLKEDFWAWASSEVPPTQEGFAQPSLHMLLSDAKPLVDTYPKAFTRPGVESPMFFLGFVVWGVVLLNQALGPRRWEVGRSVST